MPISSGWNHEVGGFLLIKSITDLACAFSFPNVGVLCESPASLSSLVNCENMRKEGGTRSRVLKISLRVSWKPGSIDRQTRPGTQKAMLPPLLKCFRIAVVDSGCVWLKIFPNNYCSSRGQFLRGNIRNSLSNIQANIHNFLYTVEQTLSVRTYVSTVVTAIEKSNILFYNRLEASTLKEKEDDRICAVKARFIKYGHCDTAVRRKCNVQSKFS